MSCVASRGSKTKRNKRKGGEYMSQIIDEQAAVVEPEAAEEAAVDQLDVVEETLAYDIMLLQSHAY
jgi:hypothetical protein